ncbi:MAG: hypothetical protein K8H84_09720 [Sulfuricella denitrificans]|nr:hypothetical protein [Sulfuricella denitrificans]
MEHEPAVSVFPLFDEHGRCIPSSGLAAAVHRKTRRYFSIVQPEISYGDIYARTRKFLGISGGMSAEAFEQRAEAILQNLRSDSATKGIADGVRIPFLLPKVAYADYGEALESTYLKAVHESFDDKLPQYGFINHHKDGLAGKLSIAPGSRHERLVDAMQQDQVVGYYFPCLSEYSVPAAIEQISSMPERFLLAGGFDTCAALIAAPDLLLRTDGYPPLLWLAALSGEKDQVGYHFESYGYNLTFNRRVHFNQVAEYWASGLVVLG